MPESNMIKDLTRIDREANDRLKSMKNEEPHPFERSEYDENLCTECGNGPNVTWHTK